MLNNTLFIFIKEELRNIKQDHIRDMTQVGPEYEYLVQVVNILYRQLLTNKPQCAQTCCYTNKQITDKDKHACRPTVQSNLSRGKIQLENEELRDKLDSLIQENELLTELIKEKERDNKELKEELKIKDDIVQQLEYDFKQMESEVDDLQKVNIYIYIYDNKDIQLIKYRIYAIITHQRKVHYQKYFLSLLFQFNTGYPNYT